MVNSTIILREQHHLQIKTVLDKLRMDATARIAFLVDKAGQPLAVNGDIGDLDTTSLASLAAGNVAATDGMAKLIGEREFPTLSHEGEHESLYICVIGRALLVVVFDERSSLGLVKLRVKQASRDLATVLDGIAREMLENKHTETAFFDEITDDDIDSLFN